MKLPLVIANLFFLLPLSLLGQFGGGKSDGANQNEIGPVRIDGLFLEIPYKGGKGDGENFALFAGTLNNVQAGLLFSGGRGDGEAHHNKLASLDFNYFENVYGGGPGDGHDQLKIEVLLSGLMTSDMYAGGSGDGFDNDYLLTAFDGPTDNLFGGGNGDGFDVLNTQQILSLSINPLYSGGNGDGHDQTERKNLLFPASICVGNRLLVDIDAGAGTQSGLSWQNAMTSLPFAFVNAKVCPVDRIWVAEGTYLPTANNDRNISLYPPENVSIFGGFVGFETSLAQRNWQVNTTILSGDIGVPSNNLDNSYHVLDYSNMDSISTLDGFIIEKGMASGNNASKKQGAGIFNAPSLGEQVVIIKNTTIRNCSSLGLGSGIYQTGSDAQLRLRSVIFNHNTSDLAFIISNLNNALLIIQDGVTFAQ